MAIATKPSRSSAHHMEDVFFEIKKVIVGQDHMVERLLVGLLSKGHLLLEGLPGLAKSLAISTLSHVVGGSFTRLQFTPDLLPSDITGTRIWRASQEKFDIEWGPIFANFVLTDEINRAPAKVQSALLEVMAERQVSLGGSTKPLPSPFLVLATQNPVESEGVYALPEAQRDRFMMKITVGHPTSQQEVEIVRRMSGPTPKPKQLLSLQELERIQQEAEAIYIDADVVQYCVDIVMATRSPEDYYLPELAPYIEFGASPRATLSLVAGSKALALLRGRSHVITQDVFDLAADVLRHRLVVSYEALAENISADDVVSRILSIVPSTQVTPRQHKR